MLSDRQVSDFNNRLANLEEWRRRHAPHELGPTIGEFYATYRGLPGLRGLWYPGVADQTGAVYDASGQGRTLTYNGNPTIALSAFPTPPILMPYYDLDGTGDFFSRADEAGLEISGAETYIASAQRGATFGGWFRVDDYAGANPGLMSKWATPANEAYFIRALTASSAVEARITTDGATDISVASAAGGMVEDTWNFVVARFAPSAELAIFSNDVKAVNTTGIPATIFSTGTAAFQIGAFNAGTNLLNGHWALAFVCASYIPDYFLTYLYRRGNILFGL